MKKYTLLLSLFCIGFICSGIMPYNYGIWAGEIFPTVVGLIIIITTFKKFRYTTFTYSAILVACYFMFIGSHYSYAREPLFEWIKNYFGQDRNNYDKLGHFVQGMVPVLISRELFIRKIIIRDAKWISFISFCICLATTSFYEIAEYIVCTSAGADSDSFLGMQGNIWDSQSDMLFAALGGLFIVFFLGNLHDRIIERSFPGTFEKLRSFYSKPNSPIR
jgi:putative membrane protein